MVEMIIEMPNQTNAETLQVGPVSKHQPDSAFIKGFLVKMRGFRQYMSFLLSSSISGLSMVPASHLTFKFSVKMI